MSIHVENNLKKSENTEVFEQRVHFIPCKVEDDGEANVKKYFEPYVVGDNVGLTASFRGHPLQGTELGLPQEYCGILVTEAKRPLADHADRRFQVAGGFTKIIYWNWDKKPSKNDNLVQAMQWVDIAEAIHAE